MTQLREKLDYLREELRRSGIRENKKLMTVVMVVLALVAVLVLGRAFLVSDRTPVVPSEAQAANDALVEQMLAQESAPPPVEAEPVEPGAGRRMQSPP